MTDRKSLVIESGTTKQIPDGDSLVVGVGIKVATGTTLTIGAIGDTIDVPGDLSVTGNLDVTGSVNSIGTTTFTENATFNGDVTFGDATAPDSSVTFAPSTTIDSNMAFGGVSPTYKITNLADGTNPNDAVNYSQLSALVTGVSAVSATAPLLSSGGPTPDISIDTAGASNGDVLTYNAGSWAAAAPANVNVGNTYVAIGDGTGIAGSAHLAFTYDALTPMATLSSDVPLLLIDNTSASGGGGGIRINSADQLELNAGGGDTVTVNSAYLTSNFRVNDDGISNPPVLFVSGASPGKVGIGTASPTFLLDVQKNAPSDTVVSHVQNTSSSGSAELRVQGNASDSQMRVLAFGTGITELQFGSVSLGRANMLAANDGASSLIIATQGTGSPIYIGTASSHGNGVAIKIEADHGNVVVNPDLTANTDFNVKGTTDANLLYVDASANAVGIGTASPATGFLDVAKFFRAKNTTDDVGAYQFCDASGTLIAQVDTVNGRVGIRTGGTPEATLDVRGTVLARNSVDSATAFRVQNAASSTVLDVDTSNSRVGIGTAAPSALFSAAEKLLIDSNGRITKYDNAAPAKGDLLAGSASSGFVAVGVGTDGQVLQADSTAAGGVSWYTIPAATDYSVVPLSTAQAANTAVTVAGSAAIATSASAARVAGIVKATNSVQVLGIVTCLVQSSRAGQISQGEAVYLSATEAGTVTDVAPTTPTQVVAELGIATAADSSGTVTVLWQPKSIVVL